MNLPDDDKNNLVALCTLSISSADTLAEAIKATAEKLNISKTALRKAISAECKGDIDKLRSETDDLLNLIGD